MLKKISIVLIVSILFSIQFIYFNNKINNNFVKINKEYLTFKNTNNEVVGEIFAFENNLIMYGFVNKNLEIGTGGDVILNAGGDKLELRVGNSNKIKITRDRIDITSKELYINNKLIE